MRESWISNLIEREESGSRSEPEKSMPDSDPAVKEALADLKSLFQQFITLFNEVKRPGSNAVYLYKLARSDNGFLIFRRGCRLIFSQPSKDQIRIQLLKREGEELKPCVDTRIRIFFHNPFSPAFWTHEGWPGFVDMNLLARHYMEMFIKKSAQ